MKIAFIDVQNNDSTAIKSLGFVIDNKKLTEYLLKKYECDKVFLYPGIDLNDEEKKLFYKSLESEKVIVREKFYKIYKDKDTFIKNNCVKCNTEVVSVSIGKTSFKCNCDVDLTMDMLDHLQEGNTIFLFSGDGDFSPLILKALEKACKVKLVSSDRSIQRKDGSIQSRMSNKLKKIVKENTNLSFLELDNYKNIIKKEIE